jgi:hypothetical protein
MECATCWIRASDDTYTVMVGEDRPSKPVFAAPKLWVVGFRRP